jgi:hypothetical protein
MTLEILENKGVLLRTYRKESQLIDHYSELSNYVTSKLVEIENKKLEIKGE